MLGIVQNLGEHCTLSDLVFGWRMNASERERSSTKEPWEAIDLGLAQNCGLTAI